MKKSHAFGHGFFAFAPELVEGGKVDHSNRLGDMRIWTIPAYLAQ
jgi:hypothetical protein